MLATHITTHAADALARVRAQYKSQPGFLSVLNALCVQIQQLEDAAYAMDAARQVSVNTYGQQLDNLGSLVGVDRNGLTDSNYYLLILATIADNFSDTTMPEILNIVQTLYQPTYVFQKSPNSPGGDGRGPAFIALGLGGASVTAISFVILVNIIQNALGAGIALVYVSKFSGTAGKTFAMAGPGGWVGGFATIASPNSGGGFASLLYNNPKT